MALHPLVVATGEWNLDGLVRLLEGLQYTSTGAVIRGSMVGLCYLLWNVAYGVILVQCRRQKSYGMPPIGMAAILAVTLVALYGPFSNQSHLFYYKEDYTTLVIWIISAVMQGAVYAQFVIYGRHHGHLSERIERHFYLVALGLPVLMVVTFWTFVVYYQDYYVNEICPIAVLVLSVDFFSALRARPKLRGLSVSVAWMIAVGDFLLYAAVVLGDMTDPYPDASFGYGFIYWVYLLTVVLNVVYAVEITRRRRALDLGRAGAPAASGA